MESKFKVGDRVMSLVNGIGEVIRIYDNTPDLKVKYPHFSDELRYSQDGKFDNHDLYPEIYKDGDIHPLLNVPVRIPKQVVKKTIEFYANVYPESAMIEPEYRKDGYDFVFSTDMADAIHNATHGVIAVAAKVKIEFEVEE